MNKFPTKDEIEEAFGEYFSKPEVLKAFHDVVPKHISYIREDGTQVSAWKIGNLLTGDGGMKLYQEQLKKAFYEQYEECKQNEENK